MEPKISVIVTIYNTKEEYLRKCIESIINQSLKEIDIILVNDGSCEKIQKICEEYKARDNRINLINQQNQGESVARNTGIENAKTENITFVDSDDWIEPDMCKELVYHIELIKNGYDIVIFNCFVNYETKQIKNSFYPKDGYLNEEDIEQIQLQNIEKGICDYYPPETNISVPWAKVYNKKFLYQNSIRFVPKIIRMPDAIFNMEAFEKAKKVEVFSNYLYHYCKNQYAICHRYSKDTISYYETYIEFVKKYIEEYHKNQKFKDTLNLKIITNIDKYMYNYFFHRDNPKKNKDVKLEFIDLLSKNLYQNAMQEVKLEYLSNYQKLVLINARKGRIVALRILKKIKEIIKEIQGKQVNKYN